MTDFVYAPDYDFTGDPLMELREVRFGNKYVLLIVKDGRTYVPGLIEHIETRGPLRQPLFYRGKRFAAGETDAVVATLEKQGFQNICFWE
ncbi:MAG: hypothetical protein HY513_04445 [Candidatus Aenigmarchaeota archaeon]|nr:hypothetical protein [Candidatus Aenigmarchaeota archaeon]